MSKNRVIVEAVLAGQSHGSVARQYGISKVWVGKLVARWRAGGWEAVEKQSTRPKSNPRATPADVVEAVITLRRDLTAAGLDGGPHTIAAHLQRAGVPSPSLVTIWRILTRAGLITPAPRKRPKRSYIRFEADLPNECWQADFTHYRLTDRSDTEILAFLDDHSRFAISLTAHRRVTGTIVVNTFRASIEQHGIPASTLTDNGFVFTTRTYKAPNAFEQELVNLGIEQKNGRPNHPQTQGKVERFQGTVKQWLTAQTQPDTIDQLQILLNEFTHYYNTERPHRSLAGRTPATAYTARAKAKPSNTNTTGHWRVRHDKINNGRITVRHAGKLHHIGLGYKLNGTLVHVLIHDLHVTIVDSQTGEILRDLTLDTSRDYQPRGVKPGPAKGTPQRGGRKKANKK